jgi:hypothetical protein
MTQIHLAAPHTVTLKELNVASPGVYSFLEGTAEDLRPQAVTHALEMGVYCLERAGNGRDLDYVRLEFERLLTSVQAAVADVPGAARAQLLAALGTGDGQVLAPVERLLREMERSTATRVGEVRELFNKELDPGRDASTLGRALRQLGELLDPGRTDSVQARLEAGLRTVTAADGTLARSVAELVSGSVRPLADEVSRLTNLVAADQAARAAREHTTLAGLDYEHATVALVERWAATVGAEVTHCGTDNRPGDLVVATTRRSLLGVELRIVIECRDQATPAGRKPISDAMKKAMEERQADWGVYLSGSEAGLAQEVGGWAEGSCDNGPWLATTAASLTAALRFVVAMARVEQAQHRQEVDEAVVAAQVARVRDAMRAVTTINARVTQIRTAADQIAEQASAMRVAVSEAVAALESAAVRAEAEAA